MGGLYAKRRAALPSSYVSFIEDHGGWEGDLGGDLGFVMLWDRDTIQDCYEGHEMAQYLVDRWFPFGTNGGGEMLCFDLAAGTDRVYLLPYIGMSDEEPILRYDSFADVAAAIMRLHK